MQLSFSLQATPVTGVMSNFHPSMKLSTLILVALTLLFAGQSFRVLLPSLVWYWGSTLDMRAELVVSYAYAPVVLALVAPLLVRWLKPRGALWAVGAGLMLCRLVEQVSTPPDMRVWAALGGSACSLGLLLLLFGQARAEGEDGLQTFAMGLLLGLSLDTGLRGLTGTLDLSWIPGPWPWLIVIALVGAFGYALWHVTRNEMSLQGEGFLSSLPLIGLGLLLFAEWQILQNQGWVATLTGWSPGLALSWIMLGNVGALLAAAYAFTSFWLRLTGWWPLLPGSALTFALIFAEVPSWTFALGLLVGQVSVGLLLAVIVGDVRQPASRAGVVRAGFAIWLGLLLLGTLIMLYYFSFVVRLLPIPRSTLAPLAGSGLTLCAVSSTWLRSREQPRRALDWTPVRLGMLMLLLPLGVLMAEALHAPKPALAKGYPVRVMTYNIRSAYGMEGRQDVEAIARVIEGAGADVVALQELSRGWFMNGGTDLLPLLSSRLQMPYTVMGAATDPLFGNAILSRYPILASGQGKLPQLDTLIGRGYVWAQLDLGAGETLLVIGAHLEPGHADARLAQTEALIDNWAAQPKTVLAGDMNALPGSPEIQMIVEAGFVDAWVEAGQEDRPRIDWIFHTPELIARDVTTIVSRASDHSAVVATIALRP